ncbi:immunoglobulin-like domain-containing protein [[Clostridium] scindens]|uniref:immunoglobulin-like domain-containing protein n=1 Tax=Clostridium scindens (strain JCM 10418 / VPI 12708) TaxID=29347 RepID=UPI00156F5769|nr:immunoglobulin-like domain-containing protein [[Clostridium] scindens]NSI90214.1 DUF5011 domain-containing protein [[Clostridium] scindens]NSJ04787.1 DUF5011 domain-containing protein [[Clostridium] scindens]
MKQRVITIGLIIGCAVLLLANFLMNMGRDEEAPVIKIEDKKITYTEGDDYAALLEGVSATDNADGDITDKVFVEKIIPSKNGEAVVYYGVLDMSNNVGTATRKVTYHAGDGSSDETDEAKEDGQEDSQEAAGENQGTDPAVQAAETATAALNLQPDGARPVMALTSESTTIKVGEGFDPISVVAGAVDDKDSVETLYQHIHAEGEYNTQAPGSYQIHYYVSDSEGNTSDPHVFTLIVE